MMAGLVAVFISACATTQDEMTADDETMAGSDQSQTDSGMTDSGTDSGADATGLDDSDSGDGTAIVDSAPMTAAEKLEQSLSVFCKRR